MRWRRRGVAPSAGRKRARDRREAEIEAEAEAEPATGRGPAERRTCRAKFAACRSGDPHPLPPPFRSPLARAPLVPSRRRRRHLVVRPPRHPGEARRAHLGGSARRLRPLRIRPRRGAAPAGARHDPTRRQGLEHERRGAPQFRVALPPAGALGRVPRRLHEGRLLLRPRRQRSARRRALPSGIDRDPPRPHGSSRAGSHRSPRGAPDAGPFCT